MQQNNKNKELLIKEWKQIYNSKASKFVLLSGVDGYKYRKQGNHYVIGNKSTVQKKTNLLQAQCKKKKMVFKPFDNLGFSFSNSSIKQILFHVNLDQEQIISKENAAKITQNFFDKQDGEQDEQIQGHSHPILINTSPICPNNTILAMYPDQELPQIIGQDIVLLLLNLFKVFPDIKIGYNSLGGGATVNNLHFQLFFGPDLIGQEKLPIQNQKRDQWKKSSLVNPNQEINLYTVGIKIQQIHSNICQALVLSPFGDNNESSQVANSISFVFGLIANQLIELCIPHNVLFSANGNQVYIILREFGDQINNFGFLEFSGVVHMDYQIKQEQIIKIKQKMKVDQKMLSLLKSNVSKHLQKFI